MNKCPSLALLKITYLTQHFFFFFFTCVVKGAELALFQDCCNKMSPSQPPCQEIYTKEARSLQLSLNKNRNQLWLQIRKYSSPLELIYI